MTEKFLITGLPRSGTYFASRVLQGLRRSVLHEEMGLHGCSSFMLTFHDGYNVKDGSTRERLRGKEVHRAHLVREPTAWATSMRKAFQKTTHLWVPMYIEKMLTPYIWIEHPALMGASGPNGRRLFHMSDAWLDMVWYEWHFRCPADIEEFVLPEEFVDWVEEKTGEICTSDAWNGSRWAPDETIKMPRSVAWWNHLEPRIRRMKH